MMDDERRRLLAHLLEGRQELRADVVEQVPKTLLCGHIRGLGLLGKVLVCQ